MKNCSKQPRYLEKTDEIKTPRREARNSGGGFQKARVDERNCARQIAKLNALHEEAIELIGTSDSSTVDGYDYRCLVSNQYYWVIYRGRCYPAKNGSKRYMSLNSAVLLQEIEAEIKQIDGTYNPSIQCVFVIRKWLPSEWIYEAGNFHVRIDLSER